MGCRERKIKRKVGGEKREGDSERDRGKETSRECEGDKERKAKISNRETENEREIH